jgi:hypothetical protein
MIDGPNGPVELWVLGSQRYRVMAPKGLPSEYGGRREGPETRAGSQTRARSSVDRALASRARGRKFESCRARYELPAVAISTAAHAPASARHGPAPARGEEIQIHDPDVLGPGPSRSRSDPAGVWPVSFSARYSSPTALRASARSRKILVRLILPSTRSYTLPLSPASGTPLARPVVPKCANARTWWLPTALTS